MNVIFCFALHVCFSYAIFFFLIIGKIVCKTRILQAGVEMGVLNTQWFIYCLFSQKTFLKYFLF